MPFHQNGVRDVSRQSYTIMPDYSGVSRIQSQSPALPYGWPKLPDKRKFESVVRKKKKLRFKLHMFQSSKIIWLLMPVLRFLASFSSVMHVVRYRQINPRFSREISPRWWCWWGGRGSKLQKRISGGRGNSPWWIRSGGGVCWSEIKTSRFEISRGWHLCIS